MKKLLLIDGNAILHRAYHAYPPLTNPKGEVINAVYGFFAMLLTVYADQKPDYLVVCFDRGAPTFRMNMFAGYHADRPKMADDFVPQVQLVHEILEKMQVQMFGLDGYEADDLIGTIATEMRNEAMSETIIVTGDRDLLQLVNPQVKVLMPLNGFTKTMLFDEAAIEEKYGVHPRQFIDYKALIGDASDGYPGVTGIGPKSAAKLLQEYGTFENLYEKVNELPEKTGIKLATDAEQAALAKQLATIVTNAPIQFDINKCECSGFDLKALRVAFREQGFTSLLTRVDALFGKEKESDQLELL
ncbi:MAG: 5'-3' exonuclease [Acidobacteriota bacterium]